MTATTLRGLALLSSRNLPTDSRAPSAGFAVVVGTLTFHTLFVESRATKSVKVPPMSTPILVPELTALRR